MSAFPGRTARCHGGGPGGSVLSLGWIVVGLDEEGEPLPFPSDPCRSDTRRFEQSEIRRVSDLPGSESRRAALDRPAARGPTQSPSRRSLGSMDAAYSFGRPTGPPGPNLRDLRTTKVDDARGRRTQPNLTAAARKGRGGNGEPRPQPRSGKPLMMRGKNPCKKETKLRLAAPELWKSEGHDVNESPQIGSRPGPATSCGGEARLRTQPSRPLGVRGEK